ncbi:MAG: TlpA family protein disulfide reductase [Gammaproteobacteria bacterium]|nr:MAG: TlpA family protein disulfide reductase [Gammaproteobacteria bacterium]RKZ98845.1 MAG: TlpA family protein disulfide reductase [Gammaproteobacteria bacterium]
MKLPNRHALFAITLLIALFVINWLNNDHQKSMPELSFTTIEGHQHQLTEYKGKPILVIFWATDCPGCIQEMPELIKLYHVFADSGLTMIGVAMAHDSIDHIKAMKIKRQMPYLITWDKDARIATAFDNVRVTPTHFLINPDGDIVMRKIGALNFNRLHEKLVNMGLVPG